MFSSIWLFHYTDRRSARYISQTKKINASTNIEVDEKLGEGVYFTDMTATDHSLEEIAYNNWQHRLTISIRQQLEYCVRVKFLEKEIQYCCKNGRQLFFYEGDVELEKRCYKITKTMDPCAGSSEPESESEEDTEYASSDSGIFRLPVEVPSSFWLYHYTNHRSARHIARSKIICASTDTDTDAACGVGVYFTDMRTRDYSLEEIACNNWTRPPTSVQQQLQYCVRVKFLKSEIEDCCEDGRRIFFYAGDVDLGSHEFIIMKTTGYCMDSSESESDTDNEYFSSG